MKERIVVVSAVLKPLATHAHKGGRRFKKSRLFQYGLKADYMLFKGFGPKSCGEYSTKF